MNDKSGMRMTYGSGSGLINDARAVILTLWFSVETLKDCSLTRSEKSGNGVPFPG